jgi:hypothetical protein
VQPVPTATPDVALCIALDAIRYRRVRHGEESSICQERATILGQDIEGVSANLSAWFRNQYQVSAYIVDGLVSSVEPSP